ncbi:MAG: glycine cleavage system aminomethyltransferase GcvT [Deltaproteobacteria bacterium]|nr:glycine cleavage system aminomethyltransferase GcvT [Deltaproteobacteria bacterium]
MKRTPLYEAHRALGARLVEFAGWEMPVQYDGILDEHAAVRTRAGLFDVSHMGEVELRGAGALAACQAVTANDVTRLADGRAQYSLLVQPDGGIVDDIIVHRVGSERVMICVNASNRDKGVAYLREHVRGAEVVDVSDETALLALQGPRATEILAPLTGAPLAALPRFAFAAGSVAGRRALIAHTGYTGEDGWELYCANADATPIWEALLAAGRGAGLQPAGLGARDTLRLEAALPLYGHELGPDTTPFEARLGWVVRMDKGEFVGRAALAAARQAGPRRCLVGLETAATGIPRADYPILHAGRRVGAVTSGTKSPTLGKGIALGYVEPAVSAVGTTLAVEVRGRAVAAAVVRVPFYRSGGPAAG